jgi:hypothetical protein
MYLRTRAFGQMAISLVPLTHSGGLDEGGQNPATSSAKEQEPLLLNVI